MKYCLPLISLFTAFTIQPEASANCAATTDLTTLQIEMPCVVYNGQAFTATLQTAPSVPGAALVWQLDPASLNPSSCAIDEPACVMVNNTLGLMVRQLDITGTTHTAELANIPVATDPSGLYWKYLNHQNTADTQAIDLRVSYYDTYTNTLAKQATIEATLRHFSEAVYEASNGIHRLGNITVFADGGHADDTDVLWLKDTDDRGQPCWFNSHLAGYGHKGQRIQHCDIGANNPTRYDMLSQPRASGYTLGHEWGHFFYGLYDEYRGSTFCNPNRPALPCSEDVPANISIMNTQWNAVDAADDNLLDARWLNFSTAQSNSTQNAHYRVYAANAWETLIRPIEQDPSPASNKRAYHPELLTHAPTTGELPSIELDTLEGLAAAVQDLQIIFKPGGMQAATRSTQAPEWIGTVQYIVIDNSTAVSAQYLHHIKAAAQSVIDQAESGDVIGIFSVDSTVTPIQPLTLIDSEATRDTLITAIEDIQTGDGAEPVTGQALNSALQAMQTSPYFEQLAHATYLFTHGSHADTRISLRQAIARLINDQVLLFILGDSQDIAINHELHEVAESTGGEFYRAATPRRLQQALETVHHRLSPTIDVTVAHAFLEFEQPTEVTFYVDEQLGEIEISVEFEGALDSLQITLQDPQGSNDPFTLDHCQDVVQEAQGEAEPYHFCTKEILHPLAGQWTLQLQPLQAVPAEATLTVTALPKNNHNSFFAAMRIEEPQPVVVGHTVTVFATLNADFPITNLSVTGWLETEDEQLIALPMRDDGMAPDRNAEDGVYTGNFTPEEAGKYLVFADFDNTGNSAQYSNFGLAYAPDQDGNVPEQQLSQVAYRFQRFALNKLWVVE